ncbi:hypothetical protein HD599_002503 [Conyzicola lurida]|uniref:Uncharacterized protein n=1 Tax=Conyzicola lurida TaxID=1172621 RepID=A0A841AJU2_9MICO|nr:hypothetical protein [Conyzicola lurida]MBB5844180.1 hypothetical protein [Conyzicola lurida]
MAAEIAEIQFSNDAHIWRLFSPDREKALEMPGFVSIHNDDDAERVTAILHGWGWKVVGMDWNDAPDGWVVPVQRHK